MRKILLCLFIAVFFAACVPNMKIAYKTADIPKENSQKLSSLVFDVEIFEDLRRVNPDDSILFVNPRSVRIAKERMCINSETHYKKLPVNFQVSEMIANHLKQQEIFKAVTFDKKDTADYYVMANLNRFYGKQGFSVAAATGAQFGLIGALATVGAKTEGVIEIELTDIKIFNKKGELVKSLGDFKRSYAERLPADAYCWCIYSNVNNKLKKFNAELTKLIQGSLEEEIKG